MVGAKPQNLYIRWQNERIFLLRFSYHLSHVIESYLLINWVPVSLVLSVSCWMLNCSHINSHYLKLFQMEGVIFLYLFFFFRGLTSESVVKELLLNAFYILFWCDFGCQSLAVKIYGIRVSYFFSRFLREGFLYMTYLLCLMNVGKHIIHFDLHTLAREM